MNIKGALANLIVRIISLLLPPKLMTDKMFFNVWEKRGYHITPVHFYEPIPDTRSLITDIWEKKSLLGGIDMNDRGQIKLITQFSSRFRKEYDRLPTKKTENPFQYYINNGSFGPVDGKMLYCMIRQNNPRKIFEIGSGYSTYLSAQAVLKNKEYNGQACEIVAFEPYPFDTLKTGFPGLTKLVATKIQQVPVSIFAELSENDILFIDSSHVLKIGSDVQYEYLEILPRLKKGVIIHIHDIFIPAEYIKDWVLKHYRFWNEQYLLQAFLSFNDSFKVLWAGSYMHLNHPDKLHESFNSYNRQEHWPASFWMKKIK